MKKDYFFIAQIGKTVGLWGDLKFHLHTDFPEQFKIGSFFESDRGELEIVDINLKRGIIRFRGYEAIDIAKKLTNCKIYVSQSKTKKECILAESEHFWFDIIGCDFYDNSDMLGEVSDIQRILDLDYLLISTSKSLIDEGFAKTFLVPYIPRYIIKSDTTLKKIETKDTKDILEAS
jgi:16S rRNA processing protein RimM